MANPDDPGPDGPPIGGPGRFDRRSRMNNLATLTYKLKGLLKQPERIRLLKQNARSLGKPDAAFQIAQAALHWNA